MKPAMLFEYRLSVRLLLSIFISYGEDAQLPRISLTSTDGGSRKGHCN